MKWFEKRSLARKKQKELDPDGNKGIHVYKWRHTIRKKSFFVGTEIEWLNTY